MNFWDILILAAVAAAVVLALRQLVRSRSVCGCGEGQAGNACGGDCRSCGKARKQSGKRCCAASPDALRDPGAGVRQKKAAELKDGTGAGIEKETGESVGGE